MNETGGLPPHPPPPPLLHQQPGTMSPPPAAAPAPASQPRAAAAALSLKARGFTVVPAIPRDRSRLLRELGHSLADLSVAMAAQVLLLSWSAWLSVLLTVLSVVFYCNYRGGDMAAADGSLAIVLGLLVYLPVLGRCAAVAAGRLRAQQHLDALQGQVLGVYMLHTGLGGCGAPHLLAQLDDGISDCMGRLAGYLMQPRPLGSLYFGPSMLSEQLPPTSRTFVLGTSMAQQLRQVHASIRRLSSVAGALLAHCSSSSSSCGGSVYVQQALALVAALVGFAASVQALLAAKDLHSPLLLRVMLRPAVVLVAPLLSGSFLAGAGLIGRPVTAAGQVFAIVVGCILQVLLMSLYTLGASLEDPFDSGPDAPPDALSLTEAMHTLAYLTAPPGRPSCSSFGGDDASALVSPLGTCGAARFSSGEVAVDVPAVQPHHQKADVAAGES